MYNEISDKFKDSGLVEIIFRESDSIIALTDYNFKTIYSNANFLNLFQIELEKSRNVELKKILPLQLFDKISLYFKDNPKNNFFRLRSVIIEIASIFKIFDIKIIKNKDSFVFLFIEDISIESLNEQLDRVGIGFITISSDRKIMKCNNAIQQYFGVPDSRTCSEYFNIEMSRVCRTTCVFFDLSQYNKISEMEMLTDTLIGKRYFKIISIPVTDEENNLLYANKLFMDITSMKLMIDELQIKNRVIEENLNLKNEFISNVTHELKTPLTSILGYSELLTKKINNVDFEPVKFYENSRKSLELIYKSAHKLLALIDNLLKLSDIENRKIKINSELINLKYLFDQISLETNNLGLHKDIDLKFEFDDKLYNVNFYSDYEKLKIILMNIINNAVKFTEKGFVKVSANLIEDSESVLFKVEDTGIGINQKYHKIIFEPFRQVDGSMTRKYSGIGVGLSLAKKYAHLLDSEIKLESEENKGTTVILKTPIKISGR